MTNEVRFPDIFPLVMTDIGDNIGRDAIGLLMGLRLIGLDHYKFTFVADYGKLRQEVKK